MVTQSAVISINKLERKLNMIYYEVVEDIGDGYACSRKFRTREEAEQYADDNDGCMNGVDYIDTDAPDFYYEGDE